MRSGDKPQLRGTNRRTSAVDLDLGPNVHVKLDGDELRQGEELRRDQRGLRVQIRLQVGCVALDEPGGGVERLARARLQLRVRDLSPRARERGDLHRLVDDSCFAC